MTKVTESFGQISLGGHATGAPWIRTHNCLHRFVPRLAVGLEGRRRIDFFRIEKGANCYPGKLSWTGYRCPWGISAHCAPFDWITFSSEAMRIPRSGGNFTFDRRDFRRWMPFLCSVTIYSFVQSREDILGSSAHDAGPTFSATFSRSRDDYQRPRADWARYCSDFHGF